MAFDTRASVVAEQPGAGRQVVERLDLQEMCRFTIEPLALTGIDGVGQNGEEIESVLARDGSEGCPIWNRECHIRVLRGPRERDAVRIGEENNAGRRAHEQLIR